MGATSLAQSCLSDDMRKLRILAVVSLLWSPGTQAEEPLAGVGTLLFAGRNDEARARIASAMAAYEETGNVQRQAICSLFLGLTDVRLEQASAAHANLERSAAQFAALGDDLGSWLALWTLGEFERGQGRFRAALAHHEKALGIVNEAAAPEKPFSVHGLLPLGPAFGFPEENLRALADDAASAKPLLLQLAELLSRSAYGAVLAEAGDLDKAEEELARASRLGAEFGGLLSSPIDVATGDLRRRQGRYGEARQSYQRALALGAFPAIALREEWIRVRVLDNLAAIDSAYGRHDEALAWNDQAVNILRNAANPERLATVLQQRGELLQYAGRNEEAAHVLDEALQCARQSGSRHREATVLATRTGLRLSLGQYGTAATDCERALALLEQVDRPELAAMLWALRAVVDLHFERYESARIVLKRAEELAQKSGFPGAIETVALVEATYRYRTGRGEAEEVKGRFLKLALLPEARGVITPETRQVLAGMLSLRSGSTPGPATSPDPKDVRLPDIRTFAYILRGKDEFDRGNFAKARELWRNGVDESVSADMRALFQMLIATAWWAEGNEAEGTRAIVEAANAVEVTTEDLQLDELLAGYLGSYRRTYFEMVVERLIGEGRLKEAFDYSERARARAFLQLAAADRQQPRQKADATLVRDARALEVRIAEQERRIVSASGDERLQLEPALRRDRAAHEAVMLRIRVGGGHDFATRVEALSVEEVQAGLPAGTTLISYFTGAHRTHAWIIDSTSFDHVALPLDAPGLERVECWGRGLGRSVRDERGVAPNDRCAASDASAEEVYAAVFAPLKTKIRNRRLVLVPHRPLHYVPFAALRDPETARYLIEDYTVTYAPSASARRFLEERETPLDGSALVLGDPASMMDLPDLPSAVWEAIGTAEKLGTRAFVGAEATEELLHRMNGKVDLVHIAAHATYDGANPLFSRIALAPGVDHDGNLEVHEILESVDLSGVNLVVLSACATGRGKGSGGDEVVGLTRALLYAGTPGVISTLWNVKDEAASDLMEEFYCRLLAGDSAADALRTSQLVLLRSERFYDPQFWAAFSLAGDPQARWSRTH